SSNATDGQLYAIFFHLPDSLSSSLTDGEFINVSVPLSTQDTTSSVPYVPLDSVYQTQENSYVFVVEKGKAATRVVTLGQVFGDYVQVEKGLHENDQIITNRNVLTGEKVKVTD